MDLHAAGPLPGRGRGGVRAAVAAAEDLTDRDRPRDGRADRPAPQGTGRPEVLQFSAAEVAAQLGTTVSAVNSALQRARVALADVGDVGEVTEPDDPEVRAVIGRYVRAFEAADVPALVRLLADEAVMEMPPVPLWYRSSRDYGLFMRRVFEMRGTGWGVRRLTANGQPALAAYAPEPGGGSPRSIREGDTMTARFLVLFEGRPTPRRSIDTTVTFTIRSRAGCPGCAATWSAATSRPCAVLPTCSPVPRQ
jgi:hypothetical protein